MLDTVKMCILIYCILVYLRHVMKRTVYIRL